MHRSNPIPLATPQEPLFQPLNNPPKSKPTARPRKAKANSSRRVRRKILTDEAGSSFPLRRGSLQDILTGESGVSFTLSRLQKWGIPAQGAMAGLPYDIIADIPGLGLTRIQVKTNAIPDAERIEFRMKRGFLRSKAGVFDYVSADFEIAAFVALTLDRVCFFPNPKKSFSKKATWFTTPGIEQLTFELAVNVVRHRPPEMVLPANPVNHHCNPKKYAPGPFRTAVKPVSEIDYDGSII